MHTHIRSCIHMHLRAHSSLSMFLCVCVCACACVSVCVCCIEHDPFKGEWGPVMEIKVKLFVTLMFVDDVLKYD